MTDEQETQIVRDLLKELLDKHDLGWCRCYLADGEYGLCFAKRWSDGVIGNAEVIRTLGT